MYISEENVKLGSKKEIRTFGECMLLVRLTCFANLDGKAEHVNQTSSLHADKCLVGFVFNQLAGGYTSFLNG